MLFHPFFCISLSAVPTLTLPLPSTQLYHPLPQGFSFSEAKAYIETLPAQDDPEVFGMNENAEKAYLVSQTETFIETILSVQPRIMKGLIGYVMVAMLFITAMSCGGIILFSSCPLYAQYYTIFHLVHYTAKV